MINFRQQLLTFISKIDAQYSKNNILLEEARSSTTKDEAHFKTSYIKCGAPFFKDAFGNPAPLNDDYKFRKNISKEFFPFDLPSTSARWKTREKVALINGVKQQMIDYIKSEQSKKLCAERRTRNTLQKMKYISHNQDLNQSAMLDVYRTIQLEYQNFTINWNLISFNDLQSNHSVSECMGMWHSYLRPDLNREPFSESENKLLETIVTENNFDSWVDVASQLDSRSLLQTFVHFQSVYSLSTKNKVRWTREEDEELLKAIEIYSVNGIVNWGKVGQSIFQRNKTQCYNRYQIIVKCPATRKGIFSKHENRAILDYVEKFGENAFKKMPNDFIPGRSSIQIKNHYKIALKHNGTIHPWTKPEDEQLMEFVEQHGTNDWSRIAQTLQTHNRISCRTRYLTITNYLTKNPGSTVADVPSRLKKVLTIKRANDLIESEEEEDDLNKICPSVIKTFFKHNPNLYNLFRQTFNFDFANREMQTDNAKLMVIMMMFKVEKYVIPDRKDQYFTASQKQKFNEIMKLKIGEQVNEEIEFILKHTQFLMPPNYNTIVGLRYIAIKKHEEPLDDDVALLEKKTKQFTTALVDFQKLYFSLFYWSAMLSKISVNEVSNIHFNKFRSYDKSASDMFRQFAKRRLPAIATFAKRPAALDSEHLLSAKKAKFE